ncbi:MAG: hypothetical protein WBV31_17530 [Terriglobales bacterium]|jgi:hypothetical protein
MPEFAGLQTNFLTWLILAGTTAVWVLSLRLVPGWQREGWPSVLKSLLGFVWLSFGLDILLRFSMLSYNAVEWANNSPRLLSLTADTVNRSLGYCGLFWVMVAVGYRIAARRKSAGAIGITRMFTLDLAYAVAVPMALICSVLLYLLDGPNGIPLALVTPLALFANLYILPAAMVWWDHMRRPGPWWRAGGILWLTLLPAAVNGWRSPYRENLAPIFLIPLLAALFAGRRPKLRVLVPAGLVCFLVLTTFVSAYRSIKWENARPEEVASEMRRGGVVDWFTGNWGERLARFHSFDSILLTVHLVPAARPYSGRSVLVAPFVRGFVPRLINGDKGAADAGEKFGVEIWAYDDPSARDHGGAAIAPSMPGDLYESGGAVDVALGALLWGGLIGLVDGWKKYLPGYCAAAITALVATHCAMSVERDFDHSVAAFIQTFLVVIVVGGVVALARRRKDEFAAEFDGGAAGGFGRDLVGEAVRESAGNSASNFNPTLERS